MSNQHDNSQNAAAIYALIIIGSHLACYISIGFQIWEWIHPDEFFSFLYFLIVWGIVGEFASMIVAGIVMTAIKWLTEPNNN